MSFCWKRNVLPNKIKSNSVSSTMFMKLAIKVVAFFLGHPVFQVSNYNLPDTYIINAVPCSYLWYGVIYTNDSIPKKHWHWKNYIFERAERASLGKFLHFYILKLLFLSIFCWYFRYFVGTNDMLVGLHHVYRQNSEKAWGGGGNCPLPPSGYANVHSKCILPNNPSPICQT